MQHRIDSFTSQVANNYYKMLLFEIAKESKKRKFDEVYEQVGQQVVSKKSPARGRFNIWIANIDDEGNYFTYSCDWAKKRKDRPPIEVPSQFLKSVAAHWIHKTGSWSLNATCYTSYCIELDGTEKLFQVTNSFIGRRDW